MKYQLLICAIISTGLAAAQMSSHSLTSVARPQSPTAASTSPSGQTVAVVNGAVLTDQDLLREMYSIFPYAQQHNGGFPKAQEASIRQGALQMIIFEELVYQETQKHRLAISAEKLNAAENEFRKQFKSPDEYQQYLQLEAHGSTTELRAKIRRSLLIEQFLKSEVEDKSAVTNSEIATYYEANPARFSEPESFSFQSISVIPPMTPTPQQAAEARQRAEAALAQAKTTNNYQGFGLLAEKISEDDFRVNMGDHKAVGADKLPPQVIKSLAAMKAGQVSGLIQIETAFTIIRLNAHTPAHKKSLEEVKAELKLELRKNKYEKLRSALDKRLRTGANISVS